MKRARKQVLMSESDYLASEQRAKSRHEFVGGYVFAMGGANQAHSIICSNLLILIQSSLKGTPCRTHMHDLKVQVKSKKAYYYPDILVSCEAIEPKSMFAKSPVLIVEVLSPSTAATDRREKLIAYQEILSLKEYMIVWQDRQKIELYRRAGNDHWEAFNLGGSDTLVLESLPCGTTEIAIVQIYDGLDTPMRVKEDEEAYEFSS